MKRETITAILKNYTDTVELMTAELDRDLQAAQSEDEVKDMKRRYEQNMEGVFEHTINDILALST